MTFQKRATGKARSRVGIRGAHCTTPGTGEGNVSVRVSSVSPREMNSSLAYRNNGASTTKGLRTDCGNIPALVYSHCIQKYEVNCPDLIRLVLPLA